MSYSTCLKCKKMVPWYDKYCSGCQKEFGLPNLPDWQKENFNKTYDDWETWRKKEVEKDMAKIKKAKSNG